MAIGGRTFAARPVSRYARRVPGRAIRTPRMVRTSACLLAAIVLLTLMALHAPMARAASIEGGNAFNELSQKAQQQTTPTETTATSETGVTTTTQATNSTKTIFIAVGVALVLLVGIAFVIVRDARRVAPAGDVEAIEARAARDTAVKLRNRRAKAKAARSQRKKNR